MLLPAARNVDGELMLFPVSQAISRSYASYQYCRRGPTSSLTVCCGACNSFLSLYADVRESALANVKYNVKMKIVACKRLGGLSIECWNMAPKRMFWSLS